MPKNKDIILESFKRLNTTVQGLSPDTPNITNIMRAILAEVDILTMAITKLPAKEAKETSSDMRALILKLDDLEASLRDKI